MKIESANAIVKAAEEMGNEVTLYADYSGRGMYGKKTAGVVGSLADIFAAVAAAGVYFGRRHGSGHSRFDAADDFVDDMSDLAIDNMAREMIVY